MDKFVNMVDLNRETSATVAPASTNPRSLVGFTTPTVGPTSFVAVPGLFDKADLLNLLQDAVVIRQLDGTIVDWNQAAASLYGFTTANVEERALHDFLASRFAEDDADVLTRINQELHTFGTWTGKLIQRRWDGKGISTQVRAAVAHRGGTDTPTLIFEVCHDDSECVTLNTALTVLKNENVRIKEETRRLKEELHRYADHAHRDALTGLLNRRAFYRLLDGAEQMAHGGGTPFAVLLMDLDNFKFFNDAYGHLAGDTVLDLIGKALEENSARLLRAAGTHVSLARLGGDEFAVLIYNCTPRQARRG